MEEEEDNIRICIRTPKRIGSRSADQQMINAYLANQLAILKQKLEECQGLTVSQAEPPIQTTIYNFPRIRVRVEESDDDDEADQDSLDDLSQSEEMVKDMGNINKSKEEETGGV